MPLSKTQQKKAEKRRKAGVRQISAVMAKKKSGRPGPHDSVQLAAGERKVIAANTRPAPRNGNGPLRP